MELAPSAMIKRGTDHVHSIVDNELVMMNVNTGLYVTLNETGKFIWELLENPLQVHQLEGSLMETFTVTPETFEKEVIPFLFQMIERKIIIAS